jgi:hypothetical protein
MRSLLLALLLLLLFPLSGVLADVPRQSAQACRPSIKYAERVYGIPSDLLIAIGHVESDRLDSRRGIWDSWPWTVNVEGRGQFFDTKQQAVAAVRNLITQGIRSIDVGCMQVNLMYHPTAFADLDEAFDPRANTNFAARFLRDLFRQTGNWTDAAALYHSATPALGTPYQRRVLAAWPQGRQQLEKDDALANLAAAWAATLGQSSRPPAPLPVAPSGPSGRPPVWRHLGRQMDAQATSAQ